MSLLINRVDNLRRPPDWRFQRAGELVDTAGRAATRDDAAVRNCYRFRRRLSRCQNDSDMLAALDSYPDMYEAYMIYDASDDPQEYRWELEARVLARESAEAIQRKMGISAAVIDAYITNFFDVVDRLDHQSIIVHTVMGKSVQAGLAERDHDCLWKMFGYWAGPMILDAYIYKFNTPTQPETADGVSAFWSDDAKEQLRMKASVAVRTMPVNWQTREQILAFWQKIVELEIQAGQAGVGTETFVANVQALTDSIDWQAYKPDEHGKLTGPAAQIETKGVRLRAAELTMIGMGEKPTGLEHLVHTAVFPGDNDENTA